MNSAERLERYRRILAEIHNMANGHLFGDVESKLLEIAKILKNEYGVHPIDVLAARCLLQSGLAQYARVLLHRAYDDLVRIGRDRGWLKKQ